MVNDSQYIKDAIPVPIEDGMYLDELIDLLDAIMWKNDNPELKVRAGVNLETQSVWLTLYKERSEPKV